MVAIRHITFIVIFIIGFTLGRTRSSGAGRVLGNAGTHGELLVVRSCAGRRAAIELGGHVVADNRPYRIAQEGIESFGRRWRTLQPDLGNQPYHHVSLGPGTGDKHSPPCTELERNRRLSEDS